MRTFFAVLWCGAAAIAAAAPATHTVPDTIAQRVQACTACHGKEGVPAGRDYFPRIAGKPAGYLYNQLISFREGRRSNGTMAALVENMSDDYLMEIAGYFAALDLPYAAPAAQEPAAFDLQRGRTLVERGDAGRRLPACVQCHGQKMTGVAPAVPGLLGLPKDYLLAQFGAWRSGQRRAAAPDCMHEIGNRLSAQDLGAVAAYLAQQPVPADSRPAASAASAWPIECGSTTR